MELTERERLLLIEMKDEIRKVTEEILECYADPKRWGEINKKLNHVLSLLSTLGSFSKADRNIDKFTKAAQFISGHGGLHGSLEGYQFLRVQIEAFCAAANSVRFEFTKGGIELHIQKIDLSLFKRNSHEITVRLTNEAFNSFSFPCYSPSLCHVEFMAGSPAFFMPCRRSA